MFLMGKALLLFQDCIHCFKTRVGTKILRTILYHSPSGKNRAKALFLYITTDNFVIATIHYIAAATFYKIIF
jgi:hypothetical protein